MPLDPVFPAPPRPSGATPPAGSPALPSPGFVPSAGYSRHALQLQDVPVEILLHVDADQDPAVPQARWDELFQSARRLPPNAQPEALGSMAMDASDENLYVHEGGANVLAPRWRAYVDYVQSEFAPADVVSVLATLAHRVWNEVEDLNCDWVMFGVLVPVVRILPDEWGIKLLIEMLDANPSHEEVSAALWDEGFQASDRAGPQDACELHRKLAKSLYESAEFDDEAWCGRWDALCQRIDAMGDPHAMQDALLQLAEVHIARYSLARRSMLVRIAQPLPLEICAQLCDAMTVTCGVDPALWRQHALMLDDLPRHLRGKPAMSLAGYLFRYTDEDDDRRNAQVDSVRDPGDPLLAERPRSVQGALAALSDMLSGLGLADRGAVLGMLSTSATSCNDTRELLPWNLPKVRWLLEEALKLAPIHRHGIHVVTQIARVTAQACPNDKDARALLPRLHTAVVALPLEARASALLYLVDLCARFVGEGQVKAHLDTLLAELPPVEHIERLESGQ